MKVLVITLAIVAGIFIFIQVMAKIQSNNIETYTYDVLKTYPNFEIRRYKAATFSYVELDDTSYSTGASNGFQNLGGYIFGANANNQKIAMTSPVVMDMEGGMTVKFMIPAKYKMEQLPVPNNSAVKFREEPVKTVAAITFGGFANDQKIENFKTMLFKYLSNAGIEHSTQISFFGYNSPYDLIGRRNEVIVELLNFVPDS